MANITYYLGAGASFNSNPILEKQAEMMVNVARFELRKRFLISTTENDDTRHYKFNDEEYESIPIENKKKIIWYIGYFGTKAKEYNTIDTYARKLFLNNEIEKLELLKMSVSIFYDLFENFKKRYDSNNSYSKIDNRYKSLFSLLLNKVDENKIELNNNIKIITWNYDLQLEKTYKLFKENGDNLDYNQINEELKFKSTNNQSSNDIFHLNGYHGFLSNNLPNKEEHNFENTKDPDKFWKHRELIYDALKNEQITFKNHIKYAWEHKTNDVFFENVKKVMNNTDVLVIIGYSFPAFNREIDQLLFANLKTTFKKIVYQDPNGQKLIIENLFRNKLKVKDKIEILNSEKELLQFHVPNDYFIYEEPKFKTRIT
ncbi:MAG: hypothetical protein EBR38_03465 [Flavobacteriaceae bacterium]|nr:hypothetical protein [Flavobacteriaceae bacterium]